MWTSPRRTVLAALAGAAVVVGAAALLLMMDRTDLLAGSPDSRITLPPGFTLTVYSDDVENARAMARGDRGTIFVGTRGAGNLYALRDEDGDHVAERRWLIARDLDLPTGLAFRNGSLYVAAHERILRWDGIEDRLGCIHLNDCKQPLGSHRDRHEHIGKGEIGEEAFRFIMRDKRLVGVPKILETPKGTFRRRPWDKINLDTLRRLAEK